MSDNANVSIRYELPEDIEAIGQVTQAAFATLEISSHTEQFIVTALRNANALTLSLVATQNGQVVGHIAFSPVTLSDGTQDWYGLGPVSVLPELHGKGIGRALIIEGLIRLRALGAAGCVLVGHPTYYPQFGFRNSTRLVYEGVPPDVFFVLPFQGEEPGGTVHFHPGFGATE